MAEWRMRFEGFGGAELAWQERGQGARPFVLLHGFTGFWQDFAGPLDALAEHGTTWLPDLPGHGASGRVAPERYSLDSVSALLVAWLDALNAPPVDLLGHSMGGMIALRIALAAPQRVASLVLMDTSAEPLGFIDAALLETASRVAREAGMETLEGILRARAENDDSRSPADRRVEQEWGAARFWAWRDARMHAMDPEAYARFGEAMLEAEPLSDRLGEITCPTLVLVGQDDIEFLAPSDALVAGIAGSTLARIPGAAHQPQNEAPAAWLAAVDAHLVQVRRQVSRSR